MARPYRRIGFGALPVVGMLLAAAVSATPSPSAALAKCGEFYRIKRGDTLRDITVRSLGHDRYRVIYQANRDILSSPERLETGQLIFVPCARGGAKDRLTALARTGRTTTTRDNLGDRAAALSPPPQPQQSEVKVVTPYAPKFPGKSRVAPQVPIKQETPLQSQPEKTSRPLSFITASGISPLADFPLPRGGLLPVLIEEALRAGGHEDAQEVAFVEDRQAHLSVLMPTGAFDLTFPWPGVDCTAGGLGPSGKALCQEYLVSRPVYEATVATVVPTDSPLVSATSPAALQGTRLCRPAGFPPVDLEALAVDVTVVIKRTAADCVAAVISGEVQGMSAPQGQRTAPNWPGMVVAPGLTRTVPVHALAWRNAPNAAETIATLNAGLEQLQRSGRWFEIVSTYLHDVNERSGEITGN